MVRWALGACGLLTAWAAAAGDGPQMALRLDASATGSPEAFQQVSEALARYPSCFDAVLVGGRDGDARIAALNKLGLHAVADAANEAVAGAAADDHDPRALVGGALLFASAESKGRVRVLNGQSCASGKTAHGVCVESRLDLAYGAGALDYELVGTHEPASWYANTYFSELALWRPFFQAYAQYNVET